MNHKLKFVIVIALALVSCKTSRIITHKTVQKTTSVTSVQALVNQIQKAQPHFITANMSKINMVMVLKGREIAMSGTCKMYKDSAIHLSIQPFLGIEMFKVELTPDSVKVFDKMNRNYYSVDYGYFSKRFGVDIDFYSIQSLISNQLFCIGERAVYPADLALSQLADGKSSISYETLRMQQRTVVSASNAVQQVVLKAKNSNYELQTDYDEFALSDSIRFPQKITINATNQRTSASCEFSIDKISFNTKISLTPTATERYTSGSIEQLLKK